MSGEHTTGGDEDSQSGTAPIGYKAVVEHYEDRPSQCTIYPTEHSAMNRMATWITACGDSFVALEDCR